MNGHLHPGCVSAPAEQTDLLIAEAIAAEARRQEAVIERDHSARVKALALMAVHEVAKR